MIISEQIGRISGIDGSTEGIAIQVDGCPMWDGFSVTYRFPYSQEEFEWSYLANKAVKITVELIED